MSSGFAPDAILASRRQLDLLQCSGNPGPPKDWRIKMGWPLRYLAIGAVGFFVIGCSEKAEGPPTGPDFHTVSSSSSTWTCDVGHISQLANSYFGPGRQQAVKKIVDSLAIFSASTSTKYKLGAKNKGFDVMAQI